MVMTEIRASATVLAFLALATASAAAQDPAATTERRFAEFALREIEGDPGAALDAVTSALEQALPGQRGPLLARRADLLLRLGRFDEARESLGELTSISPRFADWARARVADLPAEQDPQEELSFALRQWLNQLDFGPRARNGSAQEAYAELQALGALAVPAVLRAMEDFGPDGLTNAFELVARYDDPRVAKTVERYLAADQDPIRRAAAADAIRSMPRDVRVRLGGEALRADAARVRLGGARAVIGTGEHTELLVDALGELLRHDGATFGGEAARLLAHESLHGIERIDAWLQAAARDDESRVQEAAIVACFDRQSDTARRVAFFERLTPSGQARTIDRMCSLFEDFAEPDLMAAALGRATMDQAEELFPKIPRDALRRSPDRMVALVESFAHDPDAPDYFVEQVVQTARELNMRAVTPALVAMLECPSAEKRHYAVHALRDLAPEVIVERSGDLLPQFGQEVLLALLDRADPQTIPSLVAHVKAGSFGASTAQGGAFPGVTGSVSWDDASTPQLAAACEAIGTRSDASNLDVLLELVTVPAPGLRFGDWEARCEAAVMAFDRWFGPAHVAAAMAQVDELDIVVAQHVLDLGERHARPEHRTAVLAALERARAAGLEDPDIASEQRMLRPVGAGTIAHGCVAILAAIGDSSAVEALVDLVADPELGGAAVEYVLGVDGFDARELHRRILGDPALWQHAWASFGDPRVAQDPELRAAATAALLAWPPELEPREVETFLARVSDDERRGLATAVLDRLRDGEELRPAFTLAALSALGDFRDATLIPVLAIGLDHPDDDVRFEAVQNLQRTFSPDAAPHLIEALKDDSGSVVRAARSALERIESYVEEAQQWRDRFEQLGKNGPEAEKPGTGR